MSNLIKFHSRKEQNRRRLTYPMTHSTDISNSENIFSLKGIYSLCKKKGFLNYGFLAQIKSGKVDATYWSAKECFLIFSSEFKKFRECIRRQTYSFSTHDLYVMNWLVLSIVCLNVCDVWVDVDKDKMCLITVQSSFSFLHRPDRDMKRLKKHSRGYWESNWWPPSYVPIDSPVP